MLKSKLGWMSTLHVAQITGLSRRIVAMLCRDGWLTPAEKVRGIWFIHPLYTIVLPDYYLYPGDAEKQGERPVYEKAKVYKYKRRKPLRPWWRKAQARNKKISMVKKMLREEEERIIEKEKGA